MSHETLTEKLATIAENYWKAPDGDKYLRQLYYCAFFDNSRWDKADAWVEAANALAAFTPDYLSDGLECIAMARVERDAENVFVIDAAIDDALKREDVPRKVHNAFYDLIVPGVSKHYPL